MFPKYVVILGKFLTVDSFYDFGNALTMDIGLQLFVLMVLCSVKVFKFGRYKQQVLGIT